jgi:hypothetical protein
MDCLAYLHAKVSKTPEKYQPVQPIIDYPWDDLHYAEELDAAAGLDSVQICWTSTGTSSNSCW